LPFNKFNLQVLKRLIIQRELALEQAVRHAPAPLQHRNGLIYYLFKRHEQLSTPAWMTEQTRGCSCPLCALRPSVWTG
jgi:hypothetical protein